MSTLAGGPQRSSASFKLIRRLTYMMFFMFALTTDAVGKIIPEIIREFDLSMTAASAFHYATMVAIALAGVLFGHFADRIGRKKTIILGLVLFAVNSYLFVAGNNFYFFIGLLSISGAAIGIFKTGALALIGDISRSTTQHTSTMNVVEGFFGVGAIVGPLLVTALLAKGVTWKWLYVIAGTICVALIIAAYFVDYPTHEKGSEQEKIDVKRTFRMLENKYALAFSLAAFLYVAVECAIYVWMPTLVEGSEGWLSQGSRHLMGINPWLDWFSVSFFNGLTIFFTFRAVGRFLGAWMTSYFPWTAVLAVCSGLIFMCFVGSAIIGVEAAEVLLPASGLFMSVIYPTINSKGISCCPRNQHGAAAGIILFFTCGGAALGPLTMGVVSDVTGDIADGFLLATVLAGLLFGGLFLNFVFKPAERQLKRIERQEYGVGDLGSVATASSG